MKKQELIGHLNWVRDNYSNKCSFTSGVRIGLGIAITEIEKLDEPEVLAQEWIDSNSVNASSDGVTEEYVHVDDLENLIIPKQELPVIPNYVADYIEKAKKEIDLLRVFEIANGLDELDMWRKEYNWIRLYHLDFARAWLDGYEIKKEELYHIKFSENQYAQRFDESKIDSILVNDKVFAGQFTEEQIKKVNPKLMALAVEVAE